MDNYGWKNTPFRIKPRRGAGSGRRQIPHVMKGGEEHKVCSGCSSLKKLDEFYKNKSSKDGLTYQCKECYKERKT